MFFFRFIMILMIINFLFSNVVFAASESLNCDENKNAYPWCEAGKEGLGGSAGLVARFYEIALAAVGVTAFGAMVYGGILYTASAGNSSKQQDAIGWLTSAALGMVLLLGAYLLLYTINPELTSLMPPKLEEINIKANTIGQVCTVKLNEECAKISKTDNSKVGSHCEITQVNNNTVANCCYVEAGVKKCTVN